jgi:hypothetical protein
LQALFDALESITITSRHSLQKLEQQQKEITTELQAILQTNKKLFHAINVIRKHHLFRHRNMCAMMTYMKANNN